MVGAGRDRDCGWVEVASRRMDEERQDLFGTPLFGMEKMVGG
jgi:hypothetical protein